jgi:predicted glutamine amidotransferase
MCRLLGYVSTFPVSLQTAVGVDLESFVELSVKHADGWGLAHVGRESGESYVHRRPEQARQSSKLTDLASTKVSSGATLHLRWATPGLPIRIENTHPFVRGKYAFMHNGAIFKGIDALLQPELQHLLEGDTDSEKYFLVALGCIDRLGPLPGMIEAVRKISNSCDYTSLNAMLLTPDELVVVSRYRVERIPPDEPADYYEIRYKATEDRVIAASTGWKQEGWTNFPNPSVSRIDRKTLEISRHHID